MSCAIMAGVMLKKLYEVQYGQKRFRNFYL